MRVEGRVSAGKLARGEATEGTVVVVRPAARERRRGEGPNPSVLLVLLLEARLAADQVGCRPLSQRLVRRRLLRQMGLG